MADDQQDPRLKLVWPGVPNVKQPIILVKSDGGKCCKGAVSRLCLYSLVLPAIPWPGFTYDTSDLAALRYRVEKMKGKKIIYVVDNGQSDHFKLVFKTAEIAGWFDPATTR